MGWAGRLGKVKGGRRLVAYDPVAKRGWLGRLPRVADRVLTAVARCGWTDLSGRRAWVCGLFVVECGGSSWPAPPSTGLAPPRFDYAAGCGQPIPWTPRSNASNEPVAVAATTPITQPVPCSEVSAGRGSTAWPAKVSRSTA